MTAKPPRPSTKGDARPELRGDGKPVRRARTRGATQSDRGDGKPRSSSAVPTDRYERIADDDVLEVADLTSAEPGAAPRLRMLVLEAALHLAPAQSAIVAAGHTVAIGAAGRDGIDKLRFAVGEVDAMLVGMPGGEPLIEAALALGDRRPVVIASWTSGAVEAIRRTAAAGADLAAIRPHDVERIAPILLAAGRLAELRRPGGAAAGFAQPADVEAAPAAEAAPDGPSRPSGRTAPPPRSDSLGDVLDQVAASDAADGDPVGASASSARRAAAAAAAAASGDAGGAVEVDIDVDLDLDGDPAEDAGGAAAGDAADGSDGVPEADPVADLDLDDDGEGEPGGLMPAERFAQAAQNELDRARRHGHPLAVALFAVDVPLPPPPPALRGILRARAGNAVVHALRAVDLATELDQDRFLVVMPEADRAAGAEHARRIISAVSAGDPVTAAGRTFPPRVIGAVAAAQPGEELDLPRLVRDATQLLEQAQVTGASLAVET